MLQSGELVIFFLMARIAWIGVELAFSFYLLLGSPHSLVLTHALNRFRFILVPPLNYGMQIHNYVC